jgi:predicted permease
MGLGRQLARGLRALRRRDETDREIADELAQYLEAAEADLVASGSSPDAARRELRLRYGAAGALREEVRAYGWENLAESLLQDLRYGLRGLLHNPGFTLTATLTLGLGIGAATAIFSVVKPVLLEPLGYPQAERLVAISDSASDGSLVPATFGTYRELLQRSRSFDALAVAKAWHPTLTGRGEPERLDGERVSAGYFRVLGVAPALGRGFDEADDRAGGPDVVVLSDGLWRRASGADAAIVGKQVRLADRPFTVVGVMPRGFENVPGRRSEAWALLQYDASLPSFEGREWGHHLEMVGRLQAGATASAARADLAGVAAHPLPELARPAWAALPRGLVVTSLQQAATAGARPVLLALVGAAALLLAIACMNTTNLALARGARRRGELAMRAALGAAHGRLVRQLVTESLLLAALGGALGVGVAQLGIGALVSLSPPGLPRLDAIRLDGGALGFALAVTTLLGVVVGLVPALAPARGGLQRGLRDAAQRSVGGQLAARRALVVSEVALALVLLVGAGLLVRSLQRLFAIAPGFETSNVVAMKVQVAGPRFDDAETSGRFFRKALEAVRQVPGVASAAFTSQLPLSGDAGDNYGMRLAERSPDDFDGSGYRYAVSAGYFDALRIPILRGRPLDDRDGAGAPRAMVVGAEFARRVLQDREPLGARVHVGGEEQPAYTVVGVAGDVKQASLGAEQADAFYVTPEQWYFADNARWLVVRARQDEGALVPAVKQAVWSVDRDQAIVQATTLSVLVAGSEAPRRFAMQVLQAFAALALALAGVGLYGVLAASVGERLREIGVRAALGASRERLVGMVIREGMGMTLVGVGLGLAAAAFASELLASLLFGVSRLDPVTYAEVVGVLVAVAALACGVPALRAARVDPVRALRVE